MSPQPPHGDEPEADRTTALRAGCRERVLAWAAARVAAEWEGLRDLRMLTGNYARPDEREEWLTGTCRNLLELWSEPPDDLVELERRHRGIDSKRARWVAQVRRDLRDAVRDAQFWSVDAIVGAARSALADVDVDAWGAP